MPRVILFFGLFSLGCDCGGTMGGACSSGSDCEAGEVCRDGMCMVRDTIDAGRADAGDAAMIDAGNFPACPATGSCQEDSRCVDGRCVPWGTGFDDTCRREIVPGPVRPQ